MGLCYSLRSRLAAAHPSAPYGGRGGGEADIPPSTAAAAAAAEHGDPQVRHRLRQDLVAKERADKKRSKSIDKTLKAEKREYKQTHRLLLLGEPGRERGGSARSGPARQVRVGPEAAVRAGARRPRARGVGGGRGWAGAGRCAHVGGRASARPGSAAAAAGVGPGWGARAAVGVAGACGRPGGGDGPPPPPPLRCSVGRHRGAMSAPPPLPPQVAVDMKPRAGSTRGRRRVR